MGFSESFTVKMVFDKFSNYNVLVNFSAEWARFIKSSSSAIGKDKEGRKKRLSALNTLPLCGLKSERLSHGVSVFAQRRFPAKWRGTPTC